MLAMWAEKFIVINVMLKKITIQERKLLLLQFCSMVLAWTKTLLYHTPLVRIVYGILSFHNIYFKLRKKLLI